jgi:hypothetical protein
VGRSVGLVVRMGGGTIVEGCGREGVRVWSGVVTAKVEGGSFGRKGFEGGV